MKQETLEEAAYKYAESYRCPATNENEYCKHDIISAFNNGAKWQMDKQDDFAIGFGEWLFDHYNIISCYDRKELLEIYKKEKGL